MNHPTVLYVEDDDNDILLMRRAWTKAGVRDRLQTVADGMEAIRYLSGQGPYVNRIEHPMPRLVLLDLKLPKMSGLEVLKWGREQPDFHHLHVIMVSSSNQKADQEAAAVLGANDYLVKPGTFNKWMAMVEALNESWLRGNGGA